MEIDRSIRPGGYFIDDETFCRLIAAEQRERERIERQEGFGLSDREIDVLGLVGQGRSNKEIGEELKISALTVKSHLSRIKIKLDTGDRTEMVVAYFGYDLL